MGETATEAAPELPAECVRELTIAVLGAMNALGGEMMFLDEDDDFAPGVVRLARIAPWLVLCERPGDRAKGKPRRYTAYQVAAAEPGQPFKLDPDRALFVLSEKGFYAPAYWDLTLLQDPRLGALLAALAPVLPAATPAGNY